VLDIHIIDLEDVLYIGEKDVDFNDILETGASRFQDSLQVLDTTLLGTI
jgi:hypothetical protein